MDDLLTAIAGLPGQTARERRLPPDPAEQAAFLSAFAGSNDAPSSAEVTAVAPLTEEAVGPPPLAQPTVQLRLLAFAQGMFNAPPKVADAGADPDQALWLDAQATEKAPLTGLTHSVPPDGEDGAAPSLVEKRVAPDPAGPDQAIGPRLVPIGPIMPDARFDATLPGKSLSTEYAVSAAQASDPSHGPVAAETARTLAAPTTQAGVDAAKTAREIAAAPKPMDAPIAPKRVALPPAAIHPLAPQASLSAPASEGVLAAAPRPAHGDGLVDRLAIATGGVGTPKAPQEPSTTARIPQAAAVADTPPGASTAFVFGGDRLPAPAPLLAPSPTGQAAQPPLHPLADSELSSLIAIRPATLSQTAERVGGLPLSGVAMPPNLAGTAPAAMPPLVSPSALGDGIARSVRPDPVTGSALPAASIPPAPVSPHPSVVGFGMPAAADPNPPPAPVAALPSSSPPMVMPEVDRVEAALGSVSTATHPAQPAGSDRPMPADLPQPAARQIATALAGVSRDPGAAVDVALDPPELGRVRLSLAEVNGAMTLSITAERPETADLMRRHLVLLAEEFARQGLDAPSVNISGGGHGGHGGQNPNHMALPHRSMAELAAPASMPEPIARHAVNGGLDLRL